MHQSGDQDCHQVAFARHNAMLAAALSPTVYRRNAFRLSGLPVDATARQVRRLGDELRMLARLGAAPPVRARLLPVEPSPPPEEIEQALEVIRHPDRRLIEELFW